MSVPPCSKALQTLHSIEQGVEEMKAKLSELSQKLDVSNKLSATVLNQLKAKVSLVVLYIDLQGGWGKVQT